MTVALTIMHQEVIWILSNH